MSGPGRKMYQSLEPKPEGAIYPKRSRPQGGSTALLTTLVPVSQTGWRRTYKGGASRLLPSHTTGHTGPYHGGSIELSGWRCRQARKAERVEIGVGQSLLYRHMAGHAPEPRLRTGSNGRVKVGHSQPTQLRVPSAPVLPLSPDIHAESATNPGVQIPQHDRGLAEAEIASPADQVSRQWRDQLRKTDAERPTRQFPDPLLELLEGFRGDLPGRLGVVRNRESQELPFPAPGHRALRFVDLELKPGRQEATDACHDALSRPAAAHVDVAVVGIAAEAESPVGQLAIEFVEHEVRKQG